MNSVQKSLNDKKTANKSAKMGVSKETENTSAIVPVVPVPKSSTSTTLALGRSLETITFIFRPNPFPLQQALQKQLPPARGYSPFTSLSFESDTAPLPED